MTDSQYPIIVRQFTPEQAMRIVCERCHAERDIHADEISNEDIYECPGDTEKARRASTEQRCRGTACMKYVEGDACPGCKALGFYQPYVNKGCCSRKCMLQVEYAESLKRSAA